MDGGTVAAWVVAGAMIISNIGILLFALKRFDRERSEANGRLNEKLKNLEESSDKCSSGIETVSQSIGEMKTHCASMTSIFSTQITSIQKEVNSNKK
jgi:hypothetical protein